MWYTKLLFRRYQISSNHKSPLTWPRENRQHEPPELQDSVLPRRHQKADGPDNCPRLAEFCSSIPTSHPPSLGKLRRLRANVIPGTKLELELGRASPRLALCKSNDYQPNILSEANCRHNHPVTKLQKPPQEPTPKAKPTMSTMRCSGCRRQ